MESYTSDVPGVTVCGTCGDDLEPVDSSGDPPEQTVTQVCPTCETETTIGLCWYTNTAYDVVGWTNDTECLPSCERCSDDAEIAVIPIQRGVATYYCPSCVPGHNERVCP